MRPGTILLLCVAFVGGGLLGYVLGSGRVQDPDPTAPLPHERPSDPLAGLILDPSVQLGEPIMGPKLVELPFSQPSGDGRVHGAVLDVEGRPVPGVLVRASRSPAAAPAVIRRGGGPPMDPDLGTLAREAALRERRRRNLRWEAVTGSDGAYEITGLTRSRHRVNAWKEGYEVTHAVSGAYSAVPDARRDFLAVRVAGLAATVLNPDGTVAREAHLEMRCGALRRRVAWRPGEPPHLLPPGEWTITATGGKLNDLASGKAAVALSPGEPATVTLRLAELPGVHGRVLNRTCENVRVQILPLVPGAPADPATLVRGGDTAGLHHGPEEISYFRALEPGRYFVGLIQDCKRVAGSAVVEITGNRVHLDFTVVPAGPNEYLTLRAEDPDGKPLATLHATASCFVVAPRRWASGGGAVARQADGTWLVPRPVFRGGERPVSGRFTLVVESPIYGRREIDHAGPSAKFVTLRFERPGRLEVAVPGSRGSGYLGKIDVQVRRFEESDPDPIVIPCPGRRELGADGIQVWDPIAPGRYEVIAGADLWDTWHIPVARREIMVRSGVNSVEMPLPKLHSLILRTDGYPDTDFTLENVTTEQQPMSLRLRREVLYDGRLIFRNLLPGTYLIEGSGDEGAMTIRIPGPTEVRFRPDD